MKNATYWLEYLERLADGQEKGKIKAPQAVEMNNTVGKVIALAKTTLEYARLKNHLGSKSPVIQMLESGDGEEPKKELAS